jgi:DNA-binding transcriptional MerR regulator
MEELITLADLAVRSGIAARTIRYYIARGILDGPIKGGRGACYGAAHLARLDEIQKLQKKGLTLAEIARDLEKPAITPSPDAAPWWRYAIGGDVVVMVRADAAPWRLRRIQRAIGEMQSRISEDEEE